MRTARLVWGACLLALGLTAGGREPGAVTFAFGGDINLARGDVPNSVFQGLAEALRADVTLANLESPLTDATRVTSRIDLRAALEKVVALKSFTHVSVENNHALDAGEAGRKQNRATLTTMGIGAVTREPIFQTVKGVRVAFLSYLDDGEPLPLAQVRAARQRAEVVVVMPHWGAEYNVTSGRQRAQARELARAGATLIVGSGPHVLQGTERIGDTLVLYSLGNLLFDQPYPAAWLGAVVRVNVRGHDVSVCAVPTFTRSGRVRIAKGKEREKALTRLNLPACTEGKS